MNDTSALERWYRRLLAWFPAEHRRAYGDEMIGVLLAAGSEGRRRPAAGDVIDLIRGGLRARLRQAGDGSPDVGWRDALAVFSIVAPAMALEYFVVNNAVDWAYKLLSYPPGMALYVNNGPIALGGLVIFLAVTLPPLLALRGFRRTAIVAASIPAAVLTLFRIGSLVGSRKNFFLLLGLDGYLLLSVLVVIALAVSPGPRRGAAIMTARTWSVVAIAAGIAAVATTDLRYAYQAGTKVEAIVLAATFAAAAVGLVVTLPARVGRRLLLLLAIPGYAIVMELVANGGLPFANTVDQFGIGLIYPPTAVLIGVVGVLAWRSGRRSRETVDHDHAA